MWEEIILYRSASGTDYELTVRCYSRRPCKQIEERPDGGIFEVGGDRTWNSLAEMTQKLHVEIMKWESDVGD
jgi:hypothetical protein